MSCSACRSAYEMSQEELILLVYALKDADVKVAELLEKVDSEDHEAVLQMIAERLDLDSLQIAATTWKCCFKDMIAEKEERYEAESTDDNEVIFEEDGDEVGETIDDDGVRNVDENDNTGDGCMFLHMREAEDSSNDGDQVFEASSANAKGDWCGKEDFFYDSDEEVMRRYMLCIMREFIYDYDDDEPMYGGVSDDWEEYLDMIGHDKSYDWVLQTLRLLGNQFFFSYSMLSIFACFQCHLIE